MKKARRTNLRLPANTDIADVGVLSNPYKRQAEVKSNTLEQSWAPPLTASAGPLVVVVAASTCQAQGEHRKSDGPRECEGNYHAVELTTAGGTRNKT